MGGYEFTPVQNAQCKIQPIYRNAWFILLTIEQFSSASGLASSLHNYTVILLMTVSPSGSATEVAASGSPSTDYTLSGYQASSPSQLLSASTVPLYNTICTIWSSRSPISWADLLQMLSYPSLSTMSLNVSKAMHRNLLRSWDCTGWLLV